MKSVSVHIVTYNSEKDLENCLEAVFQQEYPLKEVIVIDNNSCDSTRQILESYSSQITIILNNFNNGFAGAHNQAISLSNSDFCLVLNPDATLNPDYLSNLMRAPEINDGSVGSFTGKLLRRDNPLIVDSCGVRMNKVRRAFDLGSGENSEVWNEKRFVFGVSGAAALYNRKMIDDISYNDQFFDELFFAYKEDVDVAWRAQLFGWKAVYIPDAIARHGRCWKEGSRNKQPLFVRKLSYINRYKMMMKNDNIRFIFQSFFSVFCYECLSLGYVILREPRLLSSWSTVMKEWYKIKEWRLFIQGRLRDKRGDIRLTEYGVKRVSKGDYDGI